MAPNVTSKCVQKRVKRQARKRLRTKRSGRPVANSVVTEKTDAVTETTDDVLQKLQEEWTDDAATGALICDICHKKDISLPVCLEFLTSEGADAPAARLVKHLGATCFLGPLPRSKLPLFNIAIDRSCRRTAEALFKIFGRERLDDGTAVYVSALLGEAEMLEWLLSSGFETKTRSGYHATDVAIGGKDYRCLVILLRFGLPVVGKSVRFVTNKNVRKMIEATDPHKIQNATGLSSLQDLCRSAIKRALPLTEINAFVAVEKLPLPTLLKHYLLNNVSLDLDLEGDCQ